MIIKPLYDNKKTSSTGKPQVLGSQTSVATPVNRPTVIKPIYGADSTYQYKPPVAKPVAKKPTVTAIKTPQPNLVQQTTNAAGGLLGAAGELFSDPLKTAGNVVKNIQSLDYNRIKTALGSSVKAMPGTVKVAGTLILDGVTKQQQAIDNFFHATDQKILPDFLKPWNQAQFNSKKQLEDNSMKVTSKIRQEGQKDINKAVDPYNKMGGAKNKTQAIAEAVVFNLPQMALSTGLAVATGLVTKNPALATSVGLSTSYGLGAQQVYQDARDNGLSDKEAMPYAMVGGAVIGAIDFLPLGRLLEKSGAAKPVEQTIIKKISMGILDAGFQSGFEGITESVQQVIQNAISSTYSDNKDLFKGVGMSAVVGAILGGGTDVAVNGVTAIAPGKSVNATINSVNSKIEKALNTPFIERTAQQRAIVDHLTTTQLTPDEATGLVISNNLEKTEQGKQIMKAVLQARAEDKVIRVRNSQETGDVEVTVVDPESVQKVDAEEAQTMIRDNGVYKDQYEQKSIEQIKADPVGMRDQYIQKYGNEVNTDLAREMFDGYKGSLSVSYQNAAGSLKDIVFNHLIETRKGEGNNTVLITAGGPGSGKSSVLSDTLANKKDYSLVYDTTISGKSSEKEIQKILDAGYNVNLAFVLRDPADAWANGVLRRDRIVSENYHVDSHMKAAENVLKLAQKYADDPRVDIQVFDNTKGKGMAELSTLDKISEIKYDKEDLLNKIHDTTEKAKQAGELNDEKYKAVIQDREKATVGEGRGNKPQQDSTPGKQPELKTSKKVVSNKNSKAVQGSINDRINKIGATSKSPEEYANKIYELVNDVLSKNPDREALSGLRTALNKEMYGLAGINTNSTNYKQAYAELMTVKNEDPLNGLVVAQIEEHIAEIDDKLIAGAGSANIQAARSAENIGGFEKVDVKESEANNFKLFEKVQALTEKYARQIGEGYLPSKALGVHFKNTQNIRINGMNNLSVAAHEIAHFLDQKNSITENVQENDKTVSEITSLYDQYYAGAKPNDKIETQIVEGFATLLQKYVEKPRTITEEYPSLVNSFLKEGGEFYQPVVGDILKDLKEIVSEYQGLNELDQVGAAIAQSALKSNKKDFLNWGDKIRTFMEDEIYPIEKVAKEAGVNWTTGDPSLWLRQYSRGGGVYANNILNSDTGYWALNESGDFVKKYNFNWNTLASQLKKNKIQDSFDNYLIARDQHFNWAELDRLKGIADEKGKVLDLFERFGIDASQEDIMSALADELKIEPAELKIRMAEAKQAKQEYQDQKQYLENNPYTREQVTKAYQENKSRFTEEEAMFDKLVREDLDLHHSKLVGLVDDERYTRLTAKEGYASMKRQFYDELVGESKGGVGVSTTGANKLSSLNKRTGGQQQILSPMYNSQLNHIEAVKKAMKQVIYNSFVNIAEKGTLPDLFQNVPVKTAILDGRAVFPQDDDANIIMARKNYKRYPILVNKDIRNVIDNVLTYQSMNVYEHMLNVAGRVFTIGTTGAYAPFSLVNYPADQWNAVVNTRNKYTPVLDNLKLIGRTYIGRDAQIKKYWHEWEIMGGDRMTLFQAQMGDPEAARKYILKEKNGLDKVIGLLDKGIDIASIPSKYSETFTRFAEYKRARENGKSQIVALEEAGRITAPFHHIGSWRFDNLPSAKYAVKAIPFGNAALQVFAQQARTAGTREGKVRIVASALAMAAIYMSSMAVLSHYGDDEQKEQYKDLRPQDISQYVHFPSFTGKGLMRVRVSQELSTLGSIIAMVMGSDAFGIKYTAQDYKDAATASIPRQFDLTSPMEAFFSWFNPLVKIPVELAFNKKDYPRVSDIETMGMKNRPPEFRTNEGTSEFAKMIGKTFKISPAKTDFLIQGLFGRATGVLTGKPGAYNPTTQVQRDYMFTLGRRVENYYSLKEKNDQDYNAVKNKYRTATDAEKDKILRDRARFKIIDKGLDAYHDVDEKKDPAEAARIRDKIIKYMNEFDIK